MDKIRLATPPEVESIAAEADLGPGCVVWAYDNSATGKPDFAVVRQVVEIDPAFFNGSNSRKAAFIFALETGLRMQNVPFYYFQASATEDAAPWRATVEHWGAEATSPAPEIRYKKVL